MPLHDPNACLWTTSTVSSSCTSLNRATIVLVPGSTSTVMRIESWPAGEKISWCSPGATSRRVCGAVPRNLRSMNTVVSGVSLSSTSVPVVGATSAFGGAAAGLEVPPAAGTGDAGPDRPAAGGAVTGGGAFGPAASPAGVVGAGSGRVVLYRSPAMAPMTTTPPTRMMTTRFTCGAPARLPPQSRQTAPTRDRQPVRATGLPLPRCGC